ncbi:hypothetical protein ElyMa_005836900 [Elysia marginata]|uniref:Cadherin domain-containing protein n=1 Tax=Elysia marginata TaxID=1093978 RepID=A0AAV4G048_9GAST|nr:hypothetical protein ElyMa_005836900 [Elysia marginata]
MFQPADVFNDTSSYTLTINCTDDFEQPVLKTVTVGIITNTPPVFTDNPPGKASVTIDALTTSHNNNEDLYQVQTSDANSDPVFYYMVTSPETSLLEIEYGKTCARMVILRLYRWLENLGLLTEHPVGFRTNNRPDDQLFRLCQNIQDGTLTTTV